MAQAVAVVRGTLSATASGTTDFTSSGFGTPTAAIIIACNANTTANPAAAAIQAVALWDGTTLRGVGSTAADNISTTVTYKIARAGLSFVPATGATTQINAEYTCSSITDGIRLTLSVDNTTIARYCTVILLNGVDADLQVITPNGSNGGTVTSASLGFAPLALLGISAGYTGDTPNSGTAQITGAMLSFGAARESDGAHRSLTHRSLHGAADAAVAQLVSESYLVAEIDDSSVVWGVAATTWGADTYTLTTTGTTGGALAYVVALGGADLSLDLGTVTTRTTTGTTDFANGIEPQALLLAMSTATAVNSVENTAGTASGMAFGMADATNEYSHSVVDEDAAGTTNCESVAGTSTVLDLDTSASGTRSSLVTATVTFDSDSFTLDYSAVDATARKGWYLAFGPATGGATGAVSLLHGLTRSNLTQGRLVV